MNKWKEAALQCGADRAEIVSGTDIIYDRVFRSICASNACGKYGRCYTCPPDAGDIDEMIARAKQAKTGVLYQTVHTIEDAFDIEGMLEAGQRHNACVRRLQALVRQDGMQALHLGAGGCGICERCGKMDGIPCRHPEEAMTSMEAYGVDVYHTAQNAGMKYHHGENTVTYFGLLLKEGADA